MGSGLGVGLGTGLGLGLGLALCRAYLLHEALHRLAADASLVREAEGHAEEDEEDNEECQVHGDACSGVGLGLGAKG